jgi:hypothetical protein
MTIKVLSQIFFNRGFVSALDIGPNVKKKKGKVIHCKKCLHTFNKDYILCSKNTSHWLETNFITNCIDTFLPAFFTRLLMYLLTRNYFIYCMNLETTDNFPLFQRPAEFKTCLILYSYVHT